jgi:hypothetical protein
MGCVHDVRSRGLCQIVELADCRPVVEVEVEWRFILKCVQPLRHLGRDRLELYILKSNFFNDRID